MVRRCITGPNSSRINWRGRKDFVETLTYELANNNRKKREALYRVSMQNLKNVNKRI